MYRNISKAFACRIEREQKGVVGHCLEINSTINRIGVGYFLTMIVLYFARDGFVHEHKKINYKHGDTENTEKGTAERRIFSVSAIQGKSLPGDHRGGTSFYCCTLPSLVGNVIKLSRNCLKGRIFITAGQRPAETGQAPNLLPERQDIT
ncbi:MAG: hypothetical protein LBK22_08985, partial [Tannerella sp.]|nr:hypothetical protein [Tannerella sp.]